VRVWSYGLVLSVDQHPKTYLILGIVEMLGDTSFEHTVGFLFQHTETWKIGRWPILLIESREVETLMTRKCFVSDDLSVEMSMAIEGTQWETYLGGEEEMLFLTFTLLSFNLQSLFIEPTF
jgi:hypothetical protein